MLLIVEIILTVKAWKNGWKGLADNAVKMQVFGRFENA